MCNIYKHLYKFSTTKIVISGISLALVANMLFIFTGSIFGLINEDNAIDGYETDIAGFLTIILLAPFIETIVFQYLPLKIAGLFIKKSRYVLYYTILLVSLLFGLLHGDLILYKLTAFFYGFIWICCCFLLIRKKRRPIFFTWLIHACYNGLLFGLTCLLERFE